MPYNNPPVRESPFKEQNSSLKTRIFNRPHIFRHHQRSSKREGHSTPYLFFYPSSTPAAWSNGEYNAASPQLSAAHRSYLDQQCFLQSHPVPFDSRRDVKMSFREKIDKWIANVPIQPTMDPSNELNFVNNCYPPTVESDDNSEIFQGDMSSLKDVLYWQSQKLTQCVQELYRQEKESVRSFNDRPQGEFAKKKLIFS